MPTGYRAFEIRGDPEELFLLPPAMGGDDIPLEYPATEAICRQHRAGDFKCTCFIPGTLVLTADLRWVPIETLQVGDEVMAFDEEAVGRGTRRFKKATVTQTFRRVAEVRRIKAGGREMFVTGDHPFLTYKFRQYRYNGINKGGTTVRDWQLAEQCLPGVELVQLLPVWAGDESYDGGWLAGFWDGEGTVDSLGSASGRRIGWGRLMTSQLPGQTLQRLEDLMAERGFDCARYVNLSSGVVQVRVRGGSSEQFRFLGSVRPGRLLARALARDVFGAAYGTAVAVDENEPAGLAEVVNLQTTAGTFIAEGFGVHNCGYYAFNFFGGSSDYLSTGHAMVMAEVWGHGQVTEHDHGWRAQKMQIVSFYYPLCDSEGRYDYRRERCMRPAVTWFRDDHKTWPPKLYLGCEEHSRDARYPQREPVEVEPVEVEPFNGEQIGLSLEFPEPEPEPERIDLKEWPIETFLMLLAEKFQAGVYDIDQTLQVFSAHTEWHEQATKAAAERNAARQAQYEAQRRKAEEKALRVNAARLMPGLQAGDESEIAHKSHCWKAKWGPNYGCTCGAARKWVAGLVTA